MTAERKRGAQWLILFAFAAIAFGALPFASGLAGAPALAALASPIHARLRRRLAPRRAALLIVAILWAVLVLPTAWVVSAAIHQAPTAIEQVRRTTNNLRTISTPFGTITADSLVAQAAGRSWSWISASLGPTLGALGRGITMLTIAFLGLYFLLVDGDDAWDAVRKRLPFSTDGSDSLKGVFVDVTRSTVFGAFSSAAVQGVSFGVGFWLSGNGAPVFWGMVAAFATLIPIVGNTLVWIPAMVTTVVHRDYAATGWMLLFGKIVPVMLDHVVKSAIGRRLSNTHPMITLVGVLIGVRLLGTVGLLVGPAMVQCSFALVRLYEKEYLVPTARSA